MKTKDELFLAYEVEKFNQNYNLFIKKWKHHKAEKKFHDNRPWKCLIYIIILRFHAFKSQAFMNLNEKNLLHV